MCIASKIDFNQFQYAFFHCCRCNGSVRSLITLQVTSDSKTTYSKETQDLSSKCLTCDEKVQTK